MASGLSAGAARRCHVAGKRLLRECANQLRDQRERARLAAGVLDVAPDALRHEPEQFHNVGAGPLPHGEPVAEVPVAHAMALVALVAFDLHAATPACRASRISAIPAGFRRTGIAMLLASSWMSSSPVNTRASLFRV